MARSENEKHFKINILKKYFDYVTEDDIRQCLTEHVFVFKRNNGD